MAIIYKKGYFHLVTKSTSYIMGIHDGFLVHHYYGEKIVKPYLPIFNIRYQEAYGHYMEEGRRDLSFESHSLEYPNFGRTDFRYPAIHIENEKGYSITDLIYKKHIVEKGKYELEGLPNTYCEKDDRVHSLTITLEDAAQGIEVDLLYGVFEDYDVVTRAVRIRNMSSVTKVLESALSTSLQLPTKDYELITLAGAWARERHIQRQPLHMGNQTVESLRGASSHQFNPFMALASKGATEDYGRVYGFSLVYSGNFIGRIEVDQHHMTRVTMGINPFEFKWNLGKGDVFTTPECVMAYSNQGLNALSSMYHQLYERRLCRGFYRDQIRPIIYNNWEVTFFDFNHEKLVDLAKEAKSCGMELFVLDDGWFGQRKDATTSLGDWYVNKDKLPHGLKGLGEKINNLGLKFGLWLEPEMISPISDLYKEHPDWCIHVPGYKAALGREQWVLDFSNPHIVDHVIKTIREILSSAPIDYVKWDMNRYITDAGSLYLQAHEQKELMHRYILGVYKVMETLTSDFPHVLFESCAGGGGRYDPGMLYYTPQIWTSDNTDAIERMKIQYGTSLVYPPRTMGAHVSPVPNHHVNRSYSLEERENVAMMGNFGYELNLLQLTIEEKQELKEHIVRYKSWRHILFYGKFYRLKSPFEGDYVAWMFHNETCEEALVFVFNSRARNNTLTYSIKLKGLREETLYNVEGQILSGSQLMTSGLGIKLQNKDGASKVIEIKRAREANNDLSKA